MSKRDLFKPVGSAAFSAAIAVMLSACGGGSSSTATSTDGTAATVGVVAPATTTTSTPTTTTTVATTTPATTTTTTPATTTTTTTPTTTTTTASSTGTGSTTTSTSTTVVTPTPTPATVATTTVRAAANFYRTETPVNWDYKAVYPSRTACAANEGKIFEVGPGKAYATPKAVPWLTLIPCDQVYIYYNSTPYTDIIFLAARGEANKWITIKGIPGPNGERPVFDGNNAVMPPDTGANIWVESTGMIIVYIPDGTRVARATNYKPGYLHITGLKIQNARPPAQVTNMAGVKGTWRNFSTGIAVNAVEKMAVTDCELANNGIGLFANSGNGEGGQTRNLLVARNYFHGNGNLNSASEHNAYSEGVGTIYEYNYFGPTLVGSGGDNIKERSAGVIFRYNYIEGGVDQIALRDPQSNVGNEAAQVDAWGERLASSVFIYGNILVNRGYGQSIIGHGDGAMGDYLQPRDGQLFFYGNRVLSFTDSQGYWQNNWYYPVQGVKLFDILNTRSPTTVVARNNLLYAGSATPGATPAPYALFYWQGKADFASNWTNSFINVGVSAADGVLATGTKFDGTGLGGLTNSTAQPGFVSLATNNFLTTSASPFASFSASVYPTAITKRGLTPIADPVIVPFQQ
jgi:hypothetical protein